MALGLARLFPGAQSCQGGVIGQVELQRGDGDKALGERAKIGPGIGDAGWGLPADPKIGTPARVGAAVKLVFVHPQPLAGDLPAFDLGFGEKGHVDVEKCVWFLR